MSPDSAVGSDSSHARPTSRGRACCVSLRLGRGRALTAAGPRAEACRLRGAGRRCLAPAGQGALRGAGLTLFALRAKALQSGAPDFGVSREKRVLGRFARQENSPARRGTELRGTSHRRCFSQRTFGAGRAVETNFSPFAAFSHPQNPNFPPFPPPPHPPNHPAGRPAGSARTRSRVQTLENPFWEATPSLRSPRPPKTAAGERPLLVGRSPSAPTPAPSGTHRSTPAPCSWGGCASTRSRRHCLPALPAPLLVGRAFVNSEPKALTAGQCRPAQI